MTNAEFAERLRALAEVYETHENVPQCNTNGPFYVFCFEKGRAAAAIKAFGPGIKKDDGQSYIEYFPTAWPEIKVCVFKTAVCERVKVG